MAGLRFGVKVLQHAQLEFQGGMPGFDNSIIQSRSWPAHRLADPAAAAGGTEVLGGVLGALVGVEYDAADRLLSAADRDRHGERRVRQLGVVMLTDGEPDDAS